MKPELSPPEMAVAQVEGWILGVPWALTKKAKPTAKPKAKVVGASSGGKTTKAGYVNKNGQEVLQATDLPGKGGGTNASARSPAVEMATR